MWHYDNIIINGKIGGNGNGNRAISVSTSASSTSSDVGSASGSDSDSCHHSGSNCGPCCARHGDRSQGRMPVRLSPQQGQAETSSFGSGHHPGFDSGCHFSGSGSSTIPGSGYGYGPA